ncbi:hypothetical protein PILCRDRAFT_16602 [Piloderma croceum F 1598]|uniref:Uncharacterized protein n=1 Tax=Piloderma croceum (strain F 1598) TaxID=765440 RepID=A0A0C3EV63_PILCF|nr:hypothetical protein PILCRDRAFT_16602 [Piloderma croceum F 1598]
MPSQPIRACTPATGAPSNCIPAAYTPTASAFNKPGDVATKPAPIHSMHTNTVPADPISPKPKPAHSALTDTILTVPIGLPAASTCSTITPVENAAAVLSIHTSCT